PEQERVDVLHQRAERGADAVIPVRARPAAVGEAAIAILIGTAGRLDDAVERYEFMNEEFAHCRLPCCLEDERARAVPTRNGDLLLIARYRLASRRICAVDACRSSRALSRCSRAWSARASASRSSLTAL